MPNLAPADPRQYLPALSRLAVRRQAEIDTVALAIYADDLAYDRVPVEDAERACFRLGRQPRAEFQPAFPSIGDILAACREIHTNREAAARDRQLAAREQRQISSPVMDEATAKLWLARIKAAAHGEPLP